MLALHMTIILMWTEHANINGQFEIQLAELFMNIISSLTEPSCGNFTLALEHKDADRGVS